MPRTLLTALMFGLICVAGQSSALAQGLPGRIQSNVLLNVIAAKGAECGMLRPWEAAIVSSLAEQDSLSWDDDDKARAAAETETRMADTTCDTGIVSAWIDGARPGIASEYLSLYLVVYSTLLQMDDPPEFFTELAMRDSPEEDIATIDDAIDAMEAAGRAPDGGGPWPEFVEGTAAAVHEFVPMLASGEAPADVAFLMPKAITISELWLADQDAGVATP